MGTMYKEIVIRRRTPVVVGVFIILAIMICIANIVEQVQVANYKIGFITNPLICFVTSYIIGFEVLKCKVCYRYSIIADQLIIHRLKDREQSVVENIKLKDIVFIGSPLQLKEKIITASSKKYICSLFRLNKYCCVYKEGDKFRKFYFQPSRNLISKLNMIIEK